MCEGVWHCQFAFECAFSSHNMSLWTQYKYWTTPKKSDNLIILILSSPCQGITWSLLSVLNFGEPLNLKFQNESIKKIAVLIFKSIYLLLLFRVQTFVWYFHTHEDGQYRYFGLHSHLLNYQNYSSFTNPLLSKCMFNDN